MKKVLLLVLSFFALILVESCDFNEKPEQVLNTFTSEVSGEIAQEYMGLSIKITKETAGFTPPVAARSYAYLGLALYESVVNGMTDYNTLQGLINDFSVGTVPAPENGKGYHWGECANRALSIMMLKLYSSASLANLAAVTALEHKYEVQFREETDLPTLERSKAYGEAVANAVFNYAASDGQVRAYTSNFPTSYVPPKFPGAWVPTPPGFQRALQPYWGNVRPFLPVNISGTQPPKYPDFSTDPASKFYAEGLEVYQVSKNLTPEQKVIAEFWSDDPGKTGTPPGHSISIASQVLAQEKADLGKSAETFVKMGMAVHDAFISCWKCKYDFNLMRPITYIRENIDPNYVTLLATPPFPEYTSGHSVQSGAMAVVLSEMFGYTYPFTDRTHEARTDINGAPRSFKSFEEAANEAAISRLYGGIHYRAAIDFGVEQGKKVGRNISQLSFKR